MIKFDTNNLKNKKNLLAFSSGVDSTALFFLLLEKDIDFDIAIVNYNIRTQSKQEVRYAKELATTYNKKIFIKELQNITQSNFEANARKQRYDFFNSIITKDKYDNLILAHQLNDKLEWFLMQLSKGAGVIELNGMQEVTQTKNYTIIRPLLEISKNKLLKYLQTKKIKYFIDSSNNDIKYKRNYFRKKFANEFLNEFEDGIKRSFKYIQKDYDSLMEKCTLEFNKKELFIHKCNDTNLTIRIIDKQLKNWGYILSKNQKKEILNQKEIVIDNFAISLIGNKVWLSPYTKVTIPKKFKEYYRIKKIPSKHRSYIFKNFGLNIF